MNRVNNMNKKYLDKKIRTYKQIRNYIYRPYFTIVEFALIIVAIVTSVGIFFMRELSLELGFIGVIAVVTLCGRIFKKYKERAFIDSRPDL
ncbi:MULTISPECIES: hypothetical protein [Cysteiniphilum]|uniref:hypothetical protein n=1 Tax=Cysteiniphilum TaxID=2056696 RepID=UPI00177CABD9|nr:MULTISPECIES: hypothetical protein [Cysteiniphilum]